jgi:hypothetical protein
LSRIYQTTHPNAISPKFIATQYDSGDARAGSKNRE